MANEPQSTQEATQRIVKILDANYKKVDLQSIISTNCTHLSLQDQISLLELLTEFEELFDGTLGVKPRQKKVHAILGISLLKNVKDLRRFLGMFQYYRDLWARLSEVLAPLTSLVGECGHTKVTRANKKK
eukprot:CCRYP_000340-RA/>CCRYP_000340-RA protein AED:0.47 eAED:0.73 QI:0/0/0/1/0/0.5/2/0/129